MSVNPWKVVVADNRAEFVAHLADKLSKPVKHVRTPLRDDYKQISKPDIFKTSNVRSWRDLESGMNFSVEKCQGTWSLMPYRPRQDRGLEQDMENKTVMEDGPSVQYVANAVYDVIFPRS